MTSWAITHVALSHTMQKNGDARTGACHSSQRERGHRLYNELTRSFFTPEVPSSHWTIDMLDNTDEGLAHWIEDMVCSYVRGFIHVDACLSAIPVYKQQCIPCKECYEHQYILAARCCWFQGRYKKPKYAVSFEQVLGSECALLCEMLISNKKCLLICLYLISDFHFALYTQFLHS
jgi:hypothetical protein